MSWYKSVMKFGGKCALWVSAHSPEILTVIGVGTGAAAIITTAKASKKDQHVIEDKKELALIKENKTNGLITEEEAKDKTLKAYMALGVDYASEYALPVGLYALSTTCFLCSRHILRTRFAAATAAFNAVSEAYGHYRKNVKKELGETTDYRYAHDIPSDALQICANEDGTSTEVIDISKRNVTGEDPYAYSPYARVFDSTNPYWQPNPETNLFFLTKVCRELNTTFHNRGYIFLNEVYDALGFEMTKAGQVVGWYARKDSDNKGDNYIDFGIFLNAMNGAPGVKESHRAFINQNGNEVILDFNVDGVIWDLMREDDPLTFRGKR